MIGAQKAGLFIAFVKIRIYNEGNIIKESFYGT